ncbi:PilW family protein [Marinobacter shengliensis]|uniref:PilW family protein n=1 Tax=Marinobacter shengliensis TaxID=1389223 RepID=UPI001109DF7D|nr:PilW family protein [Marinobacter shengliensis]
MVKQAGLTLVELLIASTLGLILMVGVVQLFISSSDSFRMAEAIGRMQESGRLAQDILGRSIRNADYWGCLRSVEIDNILDPSGDGYDADYHDFEGVEALEFDIAGSAGSLVENSVIIKLKGVRSSGIRMSSTHQVSASSTQIKLESLPSGVLGKDGVVMLSDCQNAVVFQLTSVNDSSLTIGHNTGSVVDPGNMKRTGSSCPNGSNSANCFPDLYESGEIFLPFSDTYQLQEDASGRRSLHLIRGISGTTATPTNFELVSEVQDLQAQVGIGPEGDNVINSWLEVTSGNLSTINSSYVKAVRLSILVRSPEDRVSRQQQAVCFPAWTDCSNDANLWRPSSADDRHYYRVYNSTYSIRNRLLDTGT